MEISYAESDNIRAYGILPAAYETVMLQEIAKAQGQPDTSGFVGFKLPPTFIRGQVYLV